MERGWDGQQTLTQESPTLDVVPVAVPVAVVVEMAVVIPGRRGGQSLCRECG